VLTAVSVLLLLGLVLVAVWLPGTNLVAALS
jgi:hypothetical protein